MAWGDGSTIGIAYAALFPETVGRMVIDSTSCLRTANEGIPNFPLNTGISGNVLDRTYNSLMDIPAIMSEWASQCVAAYNINETACSFAAKSMESNDPTTNVLSRIASITTAVASSARHFDNVVSDISYYPFDVLDFLSTPEWQYLVLVLSRLEQDLADYVPQQFDDENPPSGTNENFTLASYNAFGDPPYAYNEFSFSEIVCVDGSMEGISQIDTFSRYIQSQITTDPYSVIMAYPGVYFAICFSWPNSGNAETYRSPFPSSAKNKILMIGVTLDSEWSYEGAFATYEYVGSQNAVWLIHDAIGNGVFWDPNECTYNAIRSYFLTGMIPGAQANEAHCQQMGRFARRTIRG